MWGKSNVEVSYSRSERLDSDLDLGKDNPHSSLQCSDILPTKIVLSAGKDKILTNLGSMFSLWIKLSGSKTSWKDSTSEFILIWVLLVAIISQ